MMTSFVCFKAQYIRFGSIQPRPTETTAQGIVQTAKTAAECGGLLLSVVCAHVLKEFSPSIYQRSRNEDLKTEVCLRKSQTGHLHCRL